MKHRIPELLSILEESKLSQYTTTTTEAFKALKACVEVLDARTLEIDALHKENQQLRELVSVFVDGVLSRLPESVLDALPPHTISVLESLVKQRPFNDAQVK